MNTGSKICDKANRLEDIRALLDDGDLDGHCDL